ncbi:TPA: hypothetical protein OUD88_002865 [Enterobacter hormaechei]|nr:hypothetical protein [Enterobacter hormaechei]
MYSEKINSALSQTQSNYDQLMSLALGSSQNNKHPQEEALKDKWLAAEGFRPVITPTKDIVWTPKPKQPTENLQNYQKGLNSVSPETLVKQYPFLQYAIDNYIPACDSLVQSVKDGDMSLQYLDEMVMVMIKEGLEEALKATGGMSAQGKGALSKSTSAEESAAIIMSSPNAAKQLVAGGKDD